MTTSNITVANIISRASVILQDPTHVRWLESELLGWVSDAQRAVVARKPEAYTTVAVLSWAAGTDQNLVTMVGSGLAPARLIDVICNMGTGSTPGAAITRIDREILDEQYPAWRSATASETVRHYMVDARDPKRFHVYPPAVVTQDARIVYAAIPDDLASTASTIVLSPIYIGPILDYTLYRAFSKDSDLTPNAPERAQAHYQAFLAALGAKHKADMVTNPNAYDYKEAVEARQVGRGQ